MTAQPARHRRLTPFARALTTIRQRRGLGQRQLSIRCGYYADLVNYIERGKVDPRLSMMQDIADALSFPLADMLSPHDEIWYNTKVKQELSDEMHD